MEMREPEYIEGGTAIGNFEEGIKALFKLPERESCKGLKKLNPGGPGRHV